MLAIVVEPLEIAFAVPRNGGNAREQLVGNDSQVGGALGINAAEGTGSDFDIAMAVAGRCLGEHLHRAADGVLARERALRPAQDFDTVEIEQVEQRAEGDASIDIVDVEADAWVDGKA